VAPVVATVPGERYARSSRDRDRNKKKKQGSLVASVLGRLGEADGDNDDANDGKSIFPDDAKEVDSLEATSGPALRGVKAIHEPGKEPGSSSEEEDLMTPEAALVAPDVTPLAYTPINPTRVPGAVAPSFRTGEAANAPEPGGALDTILGTSDQHATGGRQSSIVPPSTGRPVEAPATPAFSMESAYAAMGVKSPGQQAVTESAAAALGTAATKAQMAMEPGAGMPEHQAPQVQGKSIMDSFRRFSPPQKPNL